MFLSSLQLSAIVLASDYKGAIAIHHSSISIEATPAGDRDEDCANLLLSIPGKEKKYVHEFCRSARIYDMNYGVVIVNDNVNISELYVYHIRNGVILKSYYNINIPSPYRLHSSAFNIKTKNLDTLRSDVTISLLGKADVGPLTGGYRCVTIDKTGLKEFIGKC